MSESQKVRVLIPVDVTGWIPGNTFVSDLICSLESVGCDVSHGRFRLGYPMEKWDIVNFQWPEYILDSVTPSSSDLEWLESRLQQLKQHAKIVVTVHNEVPHRYRNSMIEQLYRLLYRYADGFVHLGNASQEIIIKRFGDLVRDKKHRVIPHGNYEIYGPQIDRQEAKQTLGLNRPFAVTVFGALRHRSEWDRALVGCRVTQELGGDFLFAAGLRLAKTRPINISSAVKRVVEEFQDRWFLRKLKRYHLVKLFDSPVPANEIPILFSATEVLLIPRADVLNSGTLPLAFTYGCVVVGPDVGNVGAILRENGNPVFDPKKGKADVQRAIQEGFHLSREGSGESNYAKASIDWNWRLLGEVYKNLYRDLINDDASRDTSFTPTPQKYGTIPLPQRASSCRRSTGG